MEEVTQEKKSPLALILSAIFIFIAISLLIIYWFIPFNTIEFNSGPSHSNFTLNSNDSTDMQFYSNMRFPSNEISYTIAEDCTLQKQKDMKEAFRIIEENTILKFYESEKQEIEINCDQREYIEKGMFIAGEGGPSNITKTDKFSVILNGQILLIKDSQCPKPNVATHELLHALGFDHSTNPNNLMYNFSKCSQTIGEEIPILINGLYSTPTQPDPSITEVIATMQGKYLDTNITIKNQGLKKSEPAILEIRAGDKIIKEIEINSLEIGYGTLISIQNIWVAKISIEELEYELIYSFEELDKKNNNKKLMINN